MLVVSCCTGCKWSRMLPLVLSPVFGSTSAWRQFYAVYTCYIPFDNGSLLKRQSSCSSVSTDKRHCTWPSCADRYHSTLGIVIFVLHSLVGWSFQRTKTSYGDRSVSVHGPSVWNSLPNDLRLSDMSLETFRSRLKAFLFGHWSLDSPFAAVREFGLYK